MAQVETETVPRIIVAEKPYTNTDIALAMGAALLQCMEANPEITTELDTLRYTKQFMDLAIQSSAQEREAIALALAEVQYQAFTDDRTGLPNNRSMLWYLNEEWDPSRRILAVCVDLKGFKQVNDRLGYDHGNAVIAEAADRLRGLFRTGREEENFYEQGKTAGLRIPKTKSEDELFVNVIQWSRIGGDEFVALVQLHPNDDVEAVKKSIAERIGAQEIVAAGTDIHGGQLELRIGFHCGMVASEPADTVESFYLAINRAVTLGKSAAKQR